MIVVTGASGKLGRAVVEELVARAGSGEVGVSVRDPRAVQDLADRGVRVRRGDFDEPASLGEAFAGAAQVLVVSPAVMTGGAALSAAAVEQARLAGASRVVYTSQMGSDPVSAFVPMRTHAEVERALGAGDLPWTSLRNGFYVSSLQQLLGLLVRDGELVAPADGPVAWTTHADLAAAAAAVLLEPGRFEGTTPPLTSQAYDLAGVAGLLGVRRVVVDDDEWVAAAVAAGAPEPQARVLLGILQAARAGAFAAQDPTLAELLGRTPTSLAEVLVP